MDVPKFLEKWESFVIPGGRSDSFLVVKEACHASVRYPESPVDAVRFFLMTFFCDLFFW